MRNDPNARKLFDSITYLSDELVDEAMETRNRRPRALRRWLAAAACAILLTAAAVPAFSQSTPTLRAGDIWRGAILYGGATTDYTLRHFAAGEAVLTSPVRSHEDAQVLSVYRSMEPGDSGDVYELLLAWSDDLICRVRDGLGLTLTAGGVRDVFRNTVYDSHAPYTGQTEDYGSYRLEQELHCGGTVLTLQCTSLGSETFYQLTGLAALYQSLHGPLSLPETAGDRDLSAAAAPVVDFVSALTGQRWDLSALRLDRPGAGGDTHATLDLPLSPLTGTELSRQMYAPSGSLSIRLQPENGVYALDAVTLQGEYYTHLGEYPLITLDRAEAYLRKGYTYGGLYCPVCRAASSLPAVDFSTYDYVQVEYIYRGYAVPHYAFYCALEHRTQDGGQDHAVVYVPAVEVSGLAAYFRGQEKDHLQSLHTAP